MKFTFKDDGRIVLTAETSEEGNNLVKIKDGYYFVSITRGVLFYGAYNHLVNSTSHAQQFNNAYSGARI